MRAIAALLACLVMAGCGAAPAVGPAATAMGGVQAAEASAHGAVLLVHGHDGTAHDWDTLAPWLASEGFRPHAITLATDDWDIGDLADQVGMQVEALCRESGQDQIDVVAHSIGGLAVRDYIKHHQGDRRIRHLVTLGSPHHGIGFAAAGRWIKVARMLTPKGVYLRELNAGDETPGAVLYTCIWSTGDYTQWLPFASGRLDGAFNYRTSDTSHSGMLTDPKLRPAIEQGLTRVAGAVPGSEQRI